MSKKLIYFLTGAALLALVVGLIGYTQYNKKTVTAENQKADFTFTIDEFINEIDLFDTEEEIMIVYGGKVIQLTGNVSDINANGENYDVYMEGENPFTAVNVNVVSLIGTDIANVNIGDEITVQAFFSGKLIDIELSRGVVLTKK
jgi:hypothetical protein